MLFPIDATFCHDRRHPDGTMLSADGLTRATAASLYDEFANVTATEEILGRARPADPLTRGVTWVPVPGRSARTVD